MTDALSNIQLADIDRQSIFHPATSIADHLRDGPLIASKADGIWVKDQTGRNLMDFGAGLWCVNVGYGRSELAEAASATGLSDLLEPMAPAMVLESRMRNTPARERSSSFYSIV